MISDVLKSIDGIVLYPVVTLLLFVAVFAGVVVHVLRMKKETIERMSRLPLNES